MASSAGQSGDCDQWLRSRQRHSLAGCFAKHLGNSTGCSLVTLAWVADAIASSQTVWITRFLRCLSALPPLENRDNCLSSLQMFCRQLSICCDAIIKRAIDPNPFSFHCTLMSGPVSVFKNSCSAPLGFTRASYLIVCVFCDIMSQLFFNYSRSAARQLVAMSAFINNEHRGLPSHPRQWLCESSCRGPLRNKITDGCSPQPKIQNSTLNLLHSIEGNHDHLSDCPDSDNQSLENTSNDSCFPPKKPKRRLPARLKLEGYTNQPLDLNKNEKVDQDNRLDPIDGLEPTNLQPTSLSVQDSLTPEETSPSSIVVTIASSSPSKMSPLEALPFTTSNTKALHTTRPPQHLEKLEKKARAILTKAHKKPPAKGFSANTKTPPKLALRFMNDESTFACRFSVNTLTKELDKISYQLSDQDTLRLFQSKREGHVPFIKKNARMPPGNRPQLGLEPRSFQYPQVQPLAIKKSNQEEYQDQLNSEEIGEMQESEEVERILAFPSVSKITNMHNLPHEANYWEDIFDSYLSSASSNYPTTSSSTASSSSKHHQAWPSTHSTGHGSQVSSSENSNCGNDLFGKPFSFIKKSEPGVLSERSPSHPIKTFENCVRKGKENQLKVEILLDKFDKTEVLAQDPLNLLLRSHIKQLGSLDHRLDASYQQMGESTMGTKPLHWRSASEMLDQTQQKKRQVLQRRYGRLFSSKIAETVNFELQLQSQPSANFQVDETFEHPRRAPDPRRTCPL
ncbi:hypothetical protein O181_016112 [Austropuccinia psidii MF-1]|uniref:Uncharacterized protein n=1 Tax=Austropuccinia psidii MF-1 TaxID=1389203 RepID=A0A9Q3GRD4_9BASI|nr:hypothetical protein [Austropuccinia psidii MF-1]